MEDALLMTNREKYHQSEGGSQLLEEPCLSLFGHYGEGQRLIDILEDKYPLPSTLSQATVDFITACKRDPSVTQGVPPIRQCHHHFVAS